MFVSIDSHHCVYTLREELVNIDLSLIFESSSDSELPLADQDEEGDDEKEKEHYEHFDVQEFRTVNFEGLSILTRWIKQGTMIAVEKYNNLGKYPKMNLVQIRRATHWRTLYYVTFLAREECSRIIHTYRTLVFHIALNDRPATTQVFYIRSAPPRKHGEEESDDGEEESDDDEEESDDDEEEGKINIDRSSIVMEGGVASAAA